MSRSIGLVLLGLVVMTFAAPQQGANYPEGSPAAAKERDRYEVVGQEGGQAVVRNNGRNLTKDGDEETLEELQAKSAQYSYDSSIKDSISDQSITRQESREGLALKGMYAYSDGFYKREVHYVADEKGYRVVKELSIPIGDGPKVDPNGKADVSSSLSGSYSITADDIARPIRKSSRKV
ncbi:uncharacterized protein LOC129749999 [Uranotaenia lowii]|uniref:uncharacterized protein LOC129749999 n=1 Tax=Uranotaenia lowii TaxID=190385 RepID=UPI002479712D|nr:uncharacterized protein LOC129749999 [Uranotaenia lowii]